MLLVRFSSGSSAEPVGSHIYRANSVRHYYYFFCHYVIICGILFDLAGKTVLVGFTVSALPQVNCFDDRNLFSLFIIWPTVLLCADWSVQSGLPVAAVTACYLNAGTVKDAHLPRQTKPAGSCRLEFGHSITLIKQWLVTPCSFGQVSLRPAFHRNYLQWFFSREASKDSRIEIQRASKTRSEENGVFNRFLLHFF